MAAEDAIAREQIARSRTDQQEERRADQDVAEPTDRAHRPQLGDRPAVANGHVGPAVEDGLEQLASGVGRVGSVAVDEDDGVAVGQVFKDRPDGVPLALFADLDHPDAQPSGDGSGAVRPSCCRRRRSPPPAAHPATRPGRPSTAPASLWQGIATAIVGRSAEVVTMSAATSVGKSRQRPATSGRPVEYNARTGPRLAARSSEREDADPRTTLIDHGQGPRSQDVIVLTEGCHDEGSHVFGVKYPAP